MNSCLSFILIVAAIWTCSDEELLPGKLLYKSACYGSEGDILLKPSCAEKERMAIDTLYALTKPTECPKEMTYAYTNLTYCCDYDKNDCKEVYNGTAKFNYYRVFTGKRNGTRRASYQKISGVCHIDRNFTTYMRMTFVCITENVMSSFGNSQPVSSTAVYLHSSDYPNVTNDVDSKVVCSVSASCDTRIIITAIDLSLTNETTLEIIDGKNTKQFTRRENTGFKIAIIYTSSNHFIKVIFRNEKHVRDGKMWLQFNASYSGSYLNLSCGTGAVNQAPSVSACPGGDYSGFQPWMLALAILMPLLLIIIIIIVCIVYFKKKRKVSPLRSRLLNFSQADYNDNDNAGNQQINFEALPTTGRGNALPPLFENAQHVAPRQTLLNERKMPRIET